MKRQAYKTVDEYLKAVPEEKRAVLKKLRTTIKAAAPKAEESISYMIPSYKYAGHPLVYFAAQKNFCSLYAVGRATIKQFEKELKDFEISDTTIHFTPEHPLPLSLIKKMVKERMKQNEELAAKPSKKAQRRERYPMPAYIKNALTKNKVMDAYKARPPYQQNDYIGWITRAKREETGAKRLNQMLAELKAGNAYMNMKYKGG